jgi:hypothetical protein
MSAPAPKVGNKVRFRYEGKTLDGKIIQFMIKSQKAVIEVNIVGAVTVPITDIIRVL